MQKQIPTNILTFLLLSHLAENPSYGYRMLKSLENRSNGHWELSYGTVYGALSRMETQGLIEKCPDTGSNRKYHRITGRGREYLEEQERELSGMADQTREMILGFLNVYRSLYGGEKLQSLVDSIRREFS
jgi:PadR family transcriptional regulator PadR